MNKEKESALPTCLQWSKADIQAQGERHGIKIDDEQAQDLLEGFFEDNNEYIITVINNSMTEYVRTYRIYIGYHNKQQLK